MAQTREPYGYVYNNPLNSTDPTGLGCGVFSPGDCIDAVVEAADDAGEFVVRNRHTIIDVGTTIGAATMATACVGTVACAVGLSTANVKSPLVANKSPHLGLSSRTGLCSPV